MNKLKIPILINWQIKWMNFLLFLRKKFKDWLKDTHKIKMNHKFWNLAIKCKKPTKQSNKMKTINFQRKITYQKIITQIVNSKIKSQKQNHKIIHSMKMNSENLKHLFNVKTQSTPRLCLIIKMTTIFLSFLHKMMHNYSQF